MAVHKIKKGLRLPILGEPRQEVDKASPPSRVALVAADYVGMKPTMHVQPGDDVRRGQLLFEDKKTEGVRYTSPAAGRVVGVHRGARRALQSVVVELDRAEREGRGASSVSFSSFRNQHPSSLGRAEVKELLLESGQWTALRRRPFSKIADPAETPEALFVTAMDSSPLAPDVGKILEGRTGDFERGLAAVAKLTDGPTYVCTADDDRVRVPEISGVEHERFAGPHPAGTVGLHIHLLRPVSRQKMVWYLGLQDVIAIGRLFETGELDLERIVSLAGPRVQEPRLLKTRLGASTDDLVADQLVDGPSRVIAGSVFSGRKAMGEIHGYLGRFDQQISVIPEDEERVFLGWLGPGFDQYSIVNTHLGSLLPGKKFAFSTNTNGSKRAIVPIGMYERVMPFDILPTQLLRAISVADIEQAEKLGCLELDEEDLALCTFVCPGKNEYGPKLRNVLTTIEKEG